MDNDSVLIRQATPDDFEALAEVLAQSFPHVFRFSFGVGVDESAFILADLYREGVLPHHDNYVAEVDGKVAGVIIVEAGRDGPLPRLNRFWPTLVRNLGPLRALRALAGSVLVAMTVSDHGPERDIAYVDALAVAPGFRRRGVGRALLRHAADLAPESGCRRIALHVRANNVEALNLYRSEGYVVSPDHRLLHRIAGRILPRTRTYLMVNEID